MNAGKVGTVSCKKARIAFVAALLCLLAYVLACIMSPAAWSPDSSKVAVLVTHPPDEPEEFAIFAYDIASGNRVLLDEVKADGMLSPPTWSPDGKWIAYYRIEPSPAETTAAEAEGVNSAGSESGNTVAEKTDRPEPSSISEKLFSEESLMLPSWIPQLLAEQIDEEDVETFDVKLMIVKPDGKDKRPVHVMEWLDGDDGEMEFMFQRPQWSSDSKRLFYTRKIAEVSYIASLDIAGGQTRSHLLSSVGTFAVSPDDMWVASLLLEDGSDDAVLALARTDGNVQKYLRLGGDIENDEDYMAFITMSWSSDSRLLLAALGEDFRIVDAQTGNIQAFRDPETKEIAYGLFVGDEKMLCYLASAEAEDPNSDQKELCLKYADLRTGESRIAFNLQLPDSINGGIFSISPNGKLVLMRAVIDDEHGEDKSMLVFYDGKTQKVVRTDHWLLKPLYDDSNLIFDERLIGTWRQEDTQVVIAKGALEGTYGVAWIEGEEEDRAAASLVKLKGGTFLALFLDESVLEKKDSSGLHLFPDVFMRIGQIEPKLLLEEMEYDEVAELLDKETESAEQEAPTDYTFEGVRVAR